MGLDADRLRDELTGGLPVPMVAPGAVRTRAEWADRRDGGTRAESAGRAVAEACLAIVPELERACGEAEAPRGGVALHRPGALFARWRSSLVRGAGFGARILPHAAEIALAARAAHLPDDPALAIHDMLEEAGVPDAVREDYLYRLFRGVYGWASALRRMAWVRDPSEPGATVDLLAMRLATDEVLADPGDATTRRGNRHRRSAGAMRPDADTWPMREDPRVRLALLDAMESRYAARLAAQFHEPAAAPAGDPPLAQAVFCIDVRSEPLRRHLEAQDARIETAGFAGFFGLAVRWHGHADGGCSSRCPVLLAPRWLGGVVPDPGAHAGADAGATPLGESPAAAPVLIELLGLASTLALLRDGLAPALGRAAAGRDESAPLPPLADLAGTPLEPAEKGAVVAGLLRAMGILRPGGTRVLAPIVLLAGHGGRSANNAHASGLDCGACGGHGGAPNARLAAALLNDPGARREAARLGVAIPDDTAFVAAIHDTSTDEVRILDRDRIPASHHGHLAELERVLAAASAATRAERAPTLGIVGLDDRGLLATLRHRANDPGEVRPEWALARNAAFIAARRARTRGLPLAGRTFLHEYDPMADPDGATLEAILSAPMVVASWINLQYLASTVDNETLGAGDKNLHNRVGELGVVLGNGGDLRTGLPLQSVHAPDGRWFHEPLRLQVVVEAPWERVRAVLERQPGVRALVEHEWVRLLVLDPFGDSLRRYPAGPAEDGCECPSSPQEAHRTRHPGDRSRTPPEA